MFGLPTLAIVALIGLSAQAHPTNNVARSSSTSLSDLALQKVLSEAAQVFGPYSDKKSSLSTWMSKYPDNTKLIHMNIPGTHEATTWNLTQALTDDLKHVTDLNGGDVLPPDALRCQETSVIDQLNSGIRAFDLRFAADATNTTLVFYHNANLESQTATVNDILYAFYQWLDDHPTEAVIISFQYEGGTKKYAANDAFVQTTMFNALTDAAAKKYIVQKKNELGTLGQARGKITVFRRFDLDHLPQSYTDALPGLHFSPSLWTDDSPDIELVYNTEKNLTAYIEDFYETDSPVGSGANLNIQWKYNATTTNLLKATQSQYKDSLFWTWASSEYVADVPPETPRIMATGNGTLTPLGGVNQRLVPFLKQQKGKRVGIIMFDFYDTPGNLVETLLDL